MATPVDVAVTCGGAPHRVVYREGGALQLCDHSAEDIEAEAAVAALGGEPAECLRVQRALRTLLDRGSVLHEIAALRFHERHGTLRDPDRRWPDAAEALLRLPRPVLRAVVIEAAGSTLADDATGSGQVGDVVAALAAAAAERSVPGEAGGIGVSVRFDGHDPVLKEAKAWEGGEGARLRLTLPMNWLFDVWGPGFATVDGHFVAATDGLRFLVLQWGRARRSDDHDWTGKLVWRRAAHTPSGTWQLR